MAGATGASLDGALYYYVQTRGGGGTEAYIYNTHLYGDPMTRVLYALRIRYELAGSRAGVTRYAQHTPEQVS